MRSKWRAQKNVAIFVAFVEYTLAYTFVPILLPLEVHHRRNEPEGEGLYHSLGGLPHLLPLLLSLSLLVCVCFVFLFVEQGWDGTSFR